MSRTLGDLELSTLDGRATGAVGESGKSNCASCESVGGARSSVGSELGRFQSQSKQRKGGERCETGWEWRLTGLW